MPLYVYVVSDSKVYALFRDTLHLEIINKKRVSEHWHKIAAESGLLPGTIMARRAAMNGHITLS